MATDMNARPNEVAYYLGIAEAVAKKSTCLRRKYGAVIVNRGEVVSTGYNGAPRGCPLYRYWVLYSEPDWCRARCRL